MKPTKSGLNNNASPNALLALFGPVQASGFWKMVDHLVIWKDFVLPKQNWQDFVEWRLERSKNLGVKTRPI